MYTYEIFITKIISYKHLTVFFSFKKKLYVSFRLLIWEIWSKHFELLLDNFQEHNMELCPIFKFFLRTLETKFDHNFFMKVVLPDV